MDNDNWDIIPGHVSWSPDYSDNDKVGVKKVIDAIQARKKARETFEQDLHQLIDEFEVRLMKTNDMGHDFEMFHNKVTELLKEIK